MENTNGGVCEPNSGDSTGLHKMNAKNQICRLSFLHYLAELSLLDYNCVKFLPSLVAASVISLARFMIMPKKQPWSSTLEKCTGYKTCDLRECVLIIHDLYLSRKGWWITSCKRKI